MYERRDCGTVRAQIRGAIKGAVRGARGICVERLANVRSACECVRAAESGLVQVSCNKVGEMRYGPRDTRDDRARQRQPRSSCPVAPLRASRGPSNDALRPTNWRSRHAPFGLPLQVAATE